LRARPLPDSPLRGGAAEARPARSGRVLAWGLAILALLAAATAQAQPVKTEHVTAELVTDTTAVQPGGTVQVGLRLQHIPHWHTYWRNPGDSGLPTTLNWALPAGVQVGEIAWPAPQRLPIGPLVNYGYEGDLLLPMPLTVPADARPGSTLQLQAEVNWLVCRDVCIPENATLRLALPVAEAGVSGGQTAQAPLFARAAETRAVPLKGWTVDLQRAGNELLLTLDRPAGEKAPAAVPAVHVFPYAEQVIEPARHELFRTPSGYAVRFGLVANAEVPARFAGIAVAQGVAPASSPWGQPSPSAEFEVAPRTVAALALPAGAVPLGDAATPDAGAATVAAADPGTASPAALGLAAALLLALVGGMVLNLMPCVLPVLSIKLLGLAQPGERDQAPAALRTHALAYALGVVLSFLALAGVLLALRAAGSAVGWGFQLQEPGVVFVLALLFFLLGLNLMGAFEFGLLLPQALAGWRARRPAVDAFASGVLAVVAASPCTAPFMGAALGYAITQPAWAALAVFGALGVGMALPYMALVLAPRWRDRLPRPGPWMLRLKQALAFPMFATVVWLVWVLGLQAGIDGAAKVLLALLGLAFLVWLVQALRGSGLPARTARAAAAAAALGLGAWSWPVTAQGPTAGAATATEGRWLAYSDADLAARLARGETVFVDFTAAWCVSCQVNKRMVLNTASTQAAFDDAKVVLMRADWTRRDAEITAALARLGRNGVPVYALMRPGREPLLLPEILTAGAVRDALAQP
jgi:thiol:disulfide interchange protein DsbD